MWVVRANAWYPSLHPGAEYDLGSGRTQAQAEHFAWKRLRLRGGPCKADTCFFVIQEGADGTELSHAYVMRNTPRFIVDGASLCS